MKKYFLMGLMALSTLAVQSQAATVTIQGTGLDFNYVSSGGTYQLFDAGGVAGSFGVLATADPLASLTSTAGFASLSNIYADFRIDLASTLVYGVASNITGGFFDVLVPGFGLNLNVVSGTVTVTSGNATTLSFLANSTNLNGTDSTFGTIAPYTLTISGQGQIGLSANATGPAPNFSATGSFDITGDKSPVPEPATYAMIGGALLGLGLLRRKA